MRSIDILVQTVHLIGVAFIDILLGYNTATTSGVANQKEQYLKSLTGFATCIAKYILYHCQKKKSRIWFAINVDAHRAATLKGVITYYYYLLFNQVYCPYRALKLWQTMLHGLTNPD